MRVGCGDTHILSNTKKTIDGYNWSHSPQRTVLSEKSQPRHAWYMFPPISNSGNGRILEMKNRLVVAKDQRRSGESVCNSKTAKEGIHCAL